ncbi:MAG: hypothetical protein HRU38_25290 [Saccharospirillaceae bacterium]|nr:hypothetical protein [Saccharospirillaceae bacterium]
MSEKEILSNILNGKIFGCVEVDISVPENLKNYFEEMSPIFKHITVKLEDIGLHMQNYLEQTKTSFKDRKYLIGSMFGTKILIITPLLCWYIKHGVVVSKIYQVIEFTPDKCFSKFAEEITTDRRAGDQHSNLRLIGDTSKLIGKEN